MILTLSLMSHLAVFHFKALNLPKVTTTTQTIESPVKMKRDELERLFRAQS
jgi:hypothetical protein